MTNDKPICTRCDGKGETDDFYGYRRCRECCGTGRELTDDQRDMLGLVELVMDSRQRHGSRS